MEVDADGHVTQYERRLGKQGRARYRVKKKLVVQGAVVIDAPVADANPLGAGTIGDYFEFDFGSGYYAHFDLGLAARKALVYHLLVRGAHAHLRQHFFQHFGSGLEEVLKVRSHKHASHFRRTGAYGQVVGAVGIIMMRAQKAPEHHHHPVLVHIGFVPGVQIEARLEARVGNGTAVKELVEDFCQRFGGEGLDAINASREAMIMIQLCVLDHRKRGAGGLKEGIDRLLERQRLPGYGLEMKMVRRGSAALGAVIIDRIVLVVPGKVEHVGQMMPDGLRQMLRPGYHKMLLENGIRVDLDIVQAALAPLELKMELLLGAVLHAKETRPCRKRGRGGVGGAGSYTLGIELNL